jgi:DNA-binding MarR family transcriptional regulator
VENLVSEGLAERSASKEDRRTVEIRLTDKGNAVFNRINAAANDHFSLVFQLIHPDKHQQIAESISLLADALAHSADTVDGTSCCRLEEQ